MGSAARQAAGSIVSIGSRAGYRPDFRGLASAQLRVAREKLGLDHEGFASYLGGLVGWAVMPATVDHTFFGFEVASANVVADEVMPACRTVPDGC